MFTVQQLKYDKLPEVSLKLSEGLNCVLSADQGSTRKLAKALSGTVNQLDSCMEGQRIGYIPEVFPVPQGLRVSEWLSFVGELEQGTGKVPQVEELFSSYDEEAAFGSVKISKKLKAFDLFKIAFYAAVATEPDVLVAVYPTMNIKQEDTEKVYELLKKAAEKMPVLLIGEDPWWVSENLEEVMLLDEKGLTTAAAATLREEYPEFFHAVEEEKYGDKAEVDIAQIVEDYDDFSKILDEMEGEEQENETES